MALAHALQDNLTQKEQLLRVQLATSLGKPPVSLLQQCTNILSQVGQSQWRCHANRLCLCASGVGGGGGAGLSQNRRIDADQRFLLKSPERNRQM